MKMRIFKKILAIAMIVSMVVTSATGSVFADSGNGASVVLKILEIQPGSASDFTSEMKASLASGMGGRNVSVTTLSMPEFISKVDEVNGKYDVVYIGNNTSSGQSYSAKGALSNYKPSGSDYEYYSGNDITNLAASKIEPLISSKQLVIFDSSIFSSQYKDTKLYSNFIKYYNALGSYPNIKAITVSGLKNAVLGYSSESISKRPLLAITSAPPEYDGSNAAGGSNKMLSYTFDVKSADSSIGSGMKIRLYVDANGDGRYEESPVEAFDNIGNTEGFSINHMLPESYTGLQSWKLEAESASGAKSYVTGGTAFKGYTTTIRVLQLVSDTNTFDLTSLSNKNGINYLQKDGEFDILVTKMNISDFNRNYPNPFNGMPTEPNGNYDMIIFGFADSYPSDKLTNDSALEALQRFIDTKQSVMFTHDTIWYRVNSKIKQWFRSRVGQDIYTTDTAISGHDPIAKPKSGTSLGLTRLSLDLESGINKVSYGGYSSTLPDTKSVYKINDNLVTQYPYPIGDMSVSTTHHQYFQLDLEDPEVIPVYTLKNDYLRYHSGSNIGNLVLNKGVSKAETRFKQFDARNDYYTYTKGNVTYSGTGHDVPSTDGEFKMFVNTILKASRGANHAPAVVLRGISNGQNISSSENELRFSFNAYDVDEVPGCILPSATVYLDSNNDGTYERSYQASGVRNGEDMPFSLPLSDIAGNTFKVKVEVTDRSGAVGNAVVSLNYVDYPSLKLSVPTHGYLIGDKADISYTISTRKSSKGNEDILSNISLISDIASDVNAKGIKIKSSSGWTGPSGGKMSYALDNASFTPTPSWSSKEAILSAEFIKKGEYTIANTFKYDSRLQGKCEISDLADNFTVDVKSGQLNVEIKDDMGRGIKNVPVSINMGSAKKTADDAKTGSTGLFTQSELSSGTYSISIDAPSGYAVAPGGIEIVDPQGNIIPNANKDRIALSYGAANVTVRIKLKGNAVSKIGINDVSGKQSVSYIVSGKATARVYFNLETKLDKLDILLSVKSGGNNVTSFEPSKKLMKVTGGTEFEAGTFAVSDGKLVMPELEAGRYYAEVNISGLDPLKAYRADVTGADYKVSSIAYEGTSYDSLNASSILAMDKYRTLTIAKMPKIE